MKNKLKIKYLSGGPPQNPYFGTQGTGISKSNVEDMSRSVAGSVSNLNASQEQKQLEGFMSIPNSATSLMGKKKGGFKYKLQTGGSCPDGFILNTATGKCVPDPNFTGPIPQSWDQQAIDAGYQAPDAKTAGNFTKKVPWSMVGDFAGMAITNATSDKNAATVTKGEKVGIYGSAVASGLGKTFSGNPFALPMAMIGAQQEKRQAEVTAMNIREEERALGVANREAWKNAWQGQQSGFGYNSSTNMNMQPTGAYFGAKTGGARRVPGGLIVPIEGTDAVEYVGNKHSESEIDGVSGIHIDKITEVEHGETKQPVEMAKSGGSTKSGGKMKDYFFSAFLRLGGKSFAQRHKEILEKGGSKAKIQALVQKLAQQQEAVANQNGEKDRSPSTIAPPKKINAYGGIHKYQTAGEERDENLNLLGYDIGKGEETGNTYLPSEGSDKEAIKNWEEQQDPDKTYVRFTPTRPSSKDMKKKGKRQKLVSKMYKDAKDFGAFDGNEDSKLVENFNKNQGLALRRGNDSVFSSGRGRKISDEYKKKLKEEEEKQGTDDAIKFMAAGAGAGLGMATSLAPALAASPLGWPIAAGMILGPATAGTVQAISDKRKAKMPTKYLNNSKVSDKEYENFKLYDTQTTTPQTNAVADGIKPTATPNADGSVTVRGAQTADAVYDPADSKYKVKDANGNIIAESWSKNAAERKAQNIVMAEQAKAAKESEGVPAGQVKYEQGKTYLTPGITGVAGEAKRDVTVSSEEDPRILYYFKQNSHRSGISPFQSQYRHKETEKQALEAGFNPYLEGTKEYDEFQTKLNEKNSWHPDDMVEMPDGSYVTKEQYEKSVSGVKPTTPEQSAAAQSNADASNVTVRDQNQANAQAPSGQQSVAPGGTSNSAGQAAADAAAKAGTQDATATATSKEGTPVTQPGKERFFNKDDVKKGSKGVGRAIANVPPDQGDTGSFFGGVTNEQFKTFKANNPWFDFDAGFDPKKRDYTADNGVKGSSDVARFQKEYNSHVGEGNEIRVDGKLGEQTITAMLMFTDPSTPPVVEQEKEKEQEQEKEKEVETKREPCPPGTFRSESGDCLTIHKNITTKSYWSKTAGMSQYLAPTWALLNPYEKTRGIAGIPTVKGGPLPRVNRNQERASEREENIAATNMVRNMSGPQAAVSQVLNNKQNANMLKIQKEEGEQNKALAAAEVQLGLEASKINTAAELERQKFNRALAKEENQYAREDKLAALQQIGLVTAGNYRDMMMYEATERLANALDETGSYTRYTLMEALKRDPYFKNMPDRLIKEYANAYYNAGNRANENTNANESNRNTQKLGGARKYTSRLGELSKRRSLNFSK